MVGETVFKLSPHHSTEDWLERLGNFRMAWGTRLRNKDDCKVLEQGKDDPTLLTQNALWHYTGSKPKQDGKGKYRFTGPCVVWMARGRVIVYCTPEQAAMLRAAQKEAKIALALC